MKSVRFSIGSPLDAGPAEVRAETAQIPENSFHRASPSSRVCAVAGGDSTPRDGGSDERRGQERRCLPLAYLCMLMNIKGMFGSCLNVSHSI
jgi:hypothetical protein